MKKHLFALLFILCAAIPSFAQHRQPVATTMSADGKVISVDFRESDLLTPEPQHVSIQKAVVIRLSMRSSATESTKWKRPFLL